MSHNELRKILKTKHLPLFDILIKNNEIIASKKFADAISVINGKEELDKSQEGNKFDKILVINILDHLKQLNILSFNAADICIKFVLKDNSKCELFEYNSGNAQNRITNLLYLGNNSKAKINLFNYQQNSDSEIKYSTVMGINSEVIFNSIYTGGTRTVAKNIFDSNLNSSIEINGLIIGNNNQKFDINSSITNHKSDSKNNIKYKTIMSGDSICFLKSMSKVFKNAKNSTVHINHKGIINNNAKIHSMPFMIIKEKEVNATHSSSVYKLGDDAKFYMECRGISKHDINKFVIKEFAFSDLKHEYAYNYEFVEEEIIKMI